MMTDYFISLGYSESDMWGNFVCYNSDGRRYRIKVPIKYYNDNGPYDNVRSLGILIRVFDCSLEDYNNLPELPANLIPVLVPSKKDKL